ncbi:hypothetical protein R1flu_000810 [Riccia fluitans]|uniref:Chromo domain-containing protein n=1 Tax=Riccia fluitans TaxID=41844 RepID=A0ABD1Y1J7_9MARC
MLRKVVDENRRNWHFKLPSVLWAYQIAFKTHLGYSPYFLTFGVPPRLPLEYSHTAQVDSLHTPDNRIQAFLKLKIDRELAENNIICHQQQQQCWYQDNRPEMIYQVGDLVLWYKGPILYAVRWKFRNRWFGPDTLLCGCTHNNVVELENTSMESLLENRSTLIDLNPTGLQTLPSSRSWIRPTRPHYPPVQPEHQHNKVAPYHGCTGVLAR